MTLKEFIYANENHFVAMEYYWLMMNRTFLVLITKEEIIGIQGNGPISAKGGGNFLAKELSPRFALYGHLDNPYNYLQDKYLAKVADDDLSGEDILTKNSFNFRIRLNDIKRVTYDPNPKWGMGEYPHDGRVNIQTYDDDKIELIILGAQSCKKVVEMLKKRG